jgi:predicted small metal-binding protein
MTFSINCKEAGDLTCTHTISGETEQELFDNAKKHAMEEHGMTAAEFDEDAKKNEDKYRSLIKNI